MNHFNRSSGLVIHHSRSFLNHMPPIAHGLIHIVHVIVTSLKDGTGHAATVNLIAARDFLATFRSSMSSKLDVMAFARTIVQVHSLDDYSSAISIFTNGLSC
jgi:hypothetical protein